MRIKDRTTLDPQLKPIINAVKKAHTKAKLPGTFLALLPESNRYFVLDGKRGAVKYQYVLSGSKLIIHHAGGKTSVDL